jgi:signal peptidase II
LSKSFKVLLIILLVLLIDQTVKIWVKTTLSYGEEFQILGLDWARIHFVENPGMAFGIEFGGGYGKLALSLFRIIAVVFLIYYIRQLIKSAAPMGLLWSFALILAGAFGNIIDSAFYGLIFSESTYHGDPAVLFPPEGGYAGFLHGRVVDMFYFPIYEGTVPDWFPVWKGQQILFFRPVFNVADSAITIGVMSILIFQRRFFSNKKEDEVQVQSALETAPAISTSDNTAQSSESELTKLEN